ncbi:AI-2E family transporter [Granulicella sp. L60]|uniref:AI-2E family transporter n=1 Tax=Granulicella sp. L60 TaxID=1641866 RepID=UPI00131A9131|nr:AI-2E family transporter [Granulicella sp. L60]
MSPTRSTDLPRGEPVLLLAVILFILYFARELLVPLAFALTLAFLLAPAVTRLETRRVPRVIAVALTGILAFGCICGVGYVVAHQLMDVAQALPAYRLNIQKKMAGVHSTQEQSLEKAFDAVEGISEDLSIGARTQPGNTAGILLQQPSDQAQPVRVVDPGRSQLQANIELLMRILRPIGVFGVIIVFTIYLLMKREDLRHRILLLAGMGRISLMTQALQDAASRISQYLVMQAAVNASYGILFGSGLYLIGVPNATLWGAIAGILRVIPYVGTATGLVLPLVVSIALFSSWQQPILIIVLFLILELTATNFFEPWLYSSRTGISSLALLAMAIFWTLLWGWPGLVLSTPLTVCIVVLGRYVPQMSFLHTLLGTDAELSPPAHFYERLLAMDQHEARSVAAHFLNGKPLVQLYDSVLIPALSLVEQDRHQGVLDDVRCNFFFLCISELVAEYTPYRGPDAPPLALPTPIRPASAPTDFAVICISASDQADELTSLMLAQLMEQAAHPTLLLSAVSVSSEILDSLAKEPRTVIFVSALPPFAFSQARATCQRVRAHLPHNRIVVGLWTATDDADVIAERFGNGRPNAVVTTLEQALNQITHWNNQPISQTSIRI